MNTLRPAACRLVVVAERHWSTRRDRRSRGQLRARAATRPHALHRGREDLIGQQIEDALDPDSSTPPYRRFANRNFFEFLFI